MAKAPSWIKAGSIRIAVRHIVLVDVVYDGCMIWSIGDDKENYVKIRFADLSDSDASLLDVYSEYLAWQRVDAAEIERKRLEASRTGVPLLRHQRANVPNHEDKP